MFVAWRWVSVVLGCGGLVLLLLLLLEAAVTGSIMSHLFLLSWLSVVVVSSSYLTHFLVTGVSRRQAALHWDMGWLQRAVIR